MLALVSVLGVFLHARKNQWISCLDMEIRSITFNTYLTQSYSPKVVEEHSEKMCIYPRRFIPTCM